MAITKFLYIALDDNISGVNTAGISKIYNGEIQPISESITGVYKIIQEGSGAGPTRITWEVEQIPLTDVDIEINYNSGFTGLPNIPKNAGRHDYNIRTTLKSDPTYKGYFTSEFVGLVPDDIPEWNPAVLTAEFKSETGVTLEKDKDMTRALYIERRPITITYGETVRPYKNAARGIEYSTSPKILDQDSPDYGKDVSVIISYSIENSAPTYAAPVKIGTYFVDAASIDPNYIVSGNATTAYTIRELTTSEAAAAAQQYNSLVASLPPNTLNWINDSSDFSGGDEKEEFIASGILRILESTEINGNNAALSLVRGLDDANAIIDCSKNLPQKLITALAAKLLTLVASYIPGLGIINLITQIQQIIEDAKRILELVEFIKNNPWAFLDQVLVASGTYQKLGSIATETISEIQNTFPELSDSVGDVGQFIADVANGVIDVCQALDIYGNPISNRISVDNTRVPRGVVGFVPLTNNQPTRQKASYEKFQYRLKDALYKDNARIQRLQTEGNITELRNYVTMLTAVHELAYNWHDSIASYAAPLGLLNSSQATDLQNTENTLNILNGALQSIYDTGTSSGAQTTTSSSSGTAVSSSQLTGQLNDGFTSVANSLGVVSGALGGVDSFLSGQTLYSLRILSNEYNTAVEKQREKHPYWSDEILKEYNERVQRIRFEMQNSTSAILNNPAFAKI